MNFSIETLVFIILLLVSIAVLFAYYISVSKMKASHRESMNRQKEENFQQKKELENRAIADRERLSYYERNAEEQKKYLESLTDKFNNLLSIESQLKAENKHLKEKLEEQATEFKKLQERAATEFENIANKILKKNTEDFSDFNQKKINDLISPLKERILVFEKKVEETYEKGLKDQTDLKAELKKLHELNTRMSDEARNLTRALKGDVKKQGNWGEIVLERILERSGLTEGQEFVREKVTHNSDGKLIRPDVIVNLPDKKHIVVDSKVSLVAYEQFVNAEEAQRAQHLKNHLISIKNHVRELNSKHYSSSPELNSPDFVLLFVPIESSFSIAVEHDQQLFGFAWENKVVIVSPSTLLATLRTIASIWQQENQTKNALEIARQSGLLYDKFVGFVEDVDRLGKNINTLQKTYQDASNKLNTGTGNLVRRVEHLKELGAKASKEIPEKFKE